MIDLSLILLLGGIGLASGLLGGMLGIGGGVVIVPALILILETTGIHPTGQITVIAVATSMAVIVFTSSSAAYTQFRAGMVVWPLFVKFAPLFVAGSFCAGLLAPHVDAWLLRAIIGAFLLAVAVIMAFDWKPNPERSLPGLGGSSAIGLSGGLMAGTAGIAGGNIIVPTLIYFNVPVHNATATSSAMGVPIALFGALGYIMGVNQTHTSAWLLGYVDLQAGLWITLVAIATAPLGVKLAHRIPAKLLKRAFGYFLLLVAIRMIYSSFLLAP